MAVQDIVLLVLGWLLGLLSPAIVDAIKYRREAAHGRRAVISELKDLSLVLTLASFKSAQASGQANREYLEWIIARVSELSDRDDYQEFLQNTRSMLAFTDEQIAAGHAAISSSGQTMPMLQNYAAPLLDTRVSALWTFDTDFQRKLFSIRRNLSMLDGTVAQIKEYFRMTFDELSPGNRRIVDANMIQLYGNYTERAMMIVDQVRKLPEVGSNNSFKPTPLRGAA